MSKASKAAIVVGAANPFGQEIAAQLDDAGFAAETDHKVDLGFSRNGPRVQTMIDRFLDGLPIPDAFVINCPVDMGDTRFDAISDADFEGAMERMIVAPLLAVQSVSRRMRPGGNIVFVTSRAHLGSWGGAHLTAAGAAAITMSRCLALELKPKGLRINVVAPDFIREVEQSRDGVSHIAAAVAHLASDASAPISGHTYLLNAATSLQLRESSPRQT